MLINNLAHEVISNNTIAETLYNQPEIKRGLREANGNRVIAGLSRISFISGEGKGCLKYRGINIFDLISQFSDDQRFCFERVLFLLFIGRLPNNAELFTLREYIIEHQVISSDFFHILTGLKSKNVMNKLQTAVSALYGEDNNPDSNDAFDNMLKAVSIIAKMPSIIAYTYLTSYQKAPTYMQPKAELSLAENLLYIFHQGTLPNPEDSHLLDLCFILHAEHGGGNNSSFTAHVLTSTGTDIYSTLAASIGSLKGPLHGIANQKVMEMIVNIQENCSDPQNITSLKAYITKILKKEAYDHTGKLYGLGHAVYTLADPRAEVLKKAATKIAQKKGRNAILQLYFNIEKIAPELFKEITGKQKFLAPNVDFYSGLVYDCLGLPKEIFTPVFAMARTAGWCAHRIEEILCGKRIIRPGYRYIDSSK